MMAQETEGAAEVLQALETMTTEATAEQVPETTEATAQQAEFAIAPVVSPPDLSEVAVEVSQLVQRLSHPEEAHENENNAFSDELHENIGTKEGGVKDEFRSEMVLRDKLAQDRKKSRKEAMKKRFSFRLSNETHSKLDDKDGGEEEEEDSEEDKEEYKVESKVETKVGYKEEDNAQSFTSILDEEGDEEESKLKAKFRESQTKGMFGALHEDTAKGSKDIFYMDPDYDNSEVVSIASLKSTKSTRSLKDDTIQMKEDFLRSFEVPSLSDISEEHEPDSLSVDNVSIDSTAQAKGHFTDPLDGDIGESSSTSSEELSLSDHEAQNDAPASASPPEGSSEMSDIPDLLTTPDEPKAPKAKTITFDEIPTSFHAIEVHEYDDDDRPKLDLAVDTMVQDFVEDILEMIVTAYERHQSDNRLRSMCDRGKLLVELKNITDTFVNERYTNEMLNTRLVEYYKRIRNPRAFTQGDDEKEDQVARFNEALAKVDRLTLRLDAIKFRYEKEIAKMRLELHAVQHFVYFTETRLEHKARKYLVRPESEFLKRFVDWALRQMAAKRNEISDMRLILIRKKTTLAELQAKLAALEALSSTVSIQDFLSIQNDIINLSKKLEERNMDLNKMRTQYLMDVHITHHNREKALALGDKLAHMKTALANAIDKQRSLRASLYSKKLERTRIREKRLALTFQGGILAMPALMYEYDNTVEHVQESQKRVAKLKETVDGLSRRVSLFS